MIVDIHEAMSRLAASRPIFHSEADFQHALAWDLHARLPDMAVRLELPVHVPGKILHLDLWLAGPTGSVAIELKYKTRGLALSAGGEPFFLKDQSAQDLGRYDFLKDVQRIEQIISSHPGTQGWAILLTNDSSYWKTPNGKATTDSAFRIHDGHSIAGTLRWASHAAPGTTRGREAPIALSRTYLSHWNDYATVSAGPYGSFRYLAFSFT